MVKKKIETPVQNLEIWDHFSAPDQGPKNLARPLAKWTTFFQAFSPYNYAIWNPEIFFAPQVLRCTGGRIALIRRVTT